MKFFKIKLVLVLLALFNSPWANAADICATAALNNPNAIEGGMGGTGVTPDNGMGGTGILERGGLGRTGIVSENAAILPENTEGNIAVMGVITGFASICVNGEEVHYENATPVYNNGQPAKLGHLAVGKMVMLKAERAANGRLNAKAIGLYDAVAGPMGKIDTVRQQMQVMGQIVRMNAQLMQQVKAISPNAAVSVSGHRLETGEIVATRVEAAQTDRANSIGVVSKVAKNSFNLNGTRVNVSDAKLLENLKAGSEVRVSGDWSENALKANYIDVQPTKRLMSRADSAILEGYVHTDANHGGKLSGAELSFTQGNARSKEIESSNGKLVKIELRRDTRGDWVYDKVEERKGRLFDKHGGLNNDSERADSSSESSSGSGSNSGSESNSNSGHGSNSGSDSSGRGSSSGSNSGSQERGSSSGSSNSGRGSSSGKTERIDRSGSSDKSSGSGSSSGSDKSGTGKYR